MRDAGGVFGRRDLRHVPWWLRLPAWWLARREARGLRRAEGLDAMPQLLGWDGRILDRSYLDGAAMYQRPPHGDLAYFRAARRLLQGLHRSEEHTSELQSLMRISYAVFCLKKKNNNHCTDQIMS